jgi:hypothetical protein
MLRSIMIERIVTASTEYKISEVSNLKNSSEIIVTMQKVKMIINATTKIEVHLVKSIEAGSARISSKNITNVCAANVIRIMLPPKIATTGHSMSVRLSIYKKCLIR